MSAMAEIATVHSAELLPIVRRVRAQPSRWTFTIPPIRELVGRYVGDGRGWVDPFAGQTSPAEFTNDFNPATPTRWHLDAEAFCRDVCTDTYLGVLFDPPYSYRQVSDCYKFVGLKATMLDTSYRFYNRVMNAICDRIVEGGYAISFGWNSNGFGPNRGFEVVEVLLVAHGQHRNDTIVAVERKVAGAPRPRLVDVALPVGQLSMFEGASS